MYFLYLKTNNISPIEKNLFPFQRIFCLLEKRQLSLLENMVFFPFPMHQNRMCWRVLWPGISRLQTISKFQFYDFKLFDLLAFGLFESKWQISNHLSNLEHERDKCNALEMVKGEFKPV